MRQPTFRPRKKTKNNCIDEKQVYETVGILYCFKQLISEKGSTDGQFYLIVTYNSLQTSLKNLFKNFDFTITDDIPLSQAKSN